MVEEPGVWRRELNAEGEAVGNWGVPFLGRRLLKADFVEKCSGVAGMESPKQCRFVHFLSLLAYSL